MSYTVTYLDSASNDLAELQSYISQYSIAGAWSWLQAIDLAIEQLKNNPLANSLAPEDKDHEAEIRQFFFKTRKGRTYRGLFTIVDQTVYILHLRGPGQDLLPQDELSLPDKSP